MPSISHLVAARPTRLAPVIATTMVLALALAAWAADGAEEITIDDTISPAHLEVDVGTTVIWTNRDGDRHRMRSKDGPVEFDSGNLEPGERYRFTFTQQGSYPYYDHRDRDDAAYFGLVVVGAGPPDPDAPLPATGAVSIIDRSFDPGSVTIATGGSVTWGNADGEAHTVTATDGAFDSGILSGGGTFSQAFDQPGRYPYFCAIHPEMRGTITVSDPAASVDASTASVEPTPDTLFAATSPGPADTDASGPDRSISVVDLSFQPAAFEVETGVSVRWMNDDVVGHTVTAIDGAFDSGLLQVGAAFSTTFDTPGIYAYLCAIHPQMTGSITVLAAEP